MRQALEAAQKRFKDYSNVIGVEVGVSRGENAFDMLEHWEKLSMLYLVDNYSKGTIQLYGDARVHLEKFKHRIKWFEMSSFEAYEQFRRLGVFVDFVYIDANHTYGAVKQDIRFWDEVVKPGGVLCGHDYHRKEPGVDQAVDEYIKETGFKLYNCGSNWWIFKELTL